jgi:hypothetical protein
MAELHETLMGKKLIEHTLPDIGSQLKRIANAMENANEKHDDQKVYSFLEELEALTTDPKTAEKISQFLKQQGIW